MRFYWLKDRVEQGQFRIYWAPGDENWGDYFTKHHPITHHIKMRSCILKENNSPNDLQGCLDILKSRLARNQSIIKAYQLVKTETVNLHSQPCAGRNTIESGPATPPRMYTGPKAVYNYTNVRT